MTGSQAVVQNQRRPSTAKGERGAINNNENIKVKIKGRPVKKLLEEIDP